MNSTVRRKVGLALAAGLFFYALSDVLLWQRIFESHDLFQYDMQYQSGHVTTLVALIGTGMILLWDTGLWALWYAGAFYTLTFGGVCDVLYYWIDHRAVPGAMPWLDNDPLVFFKPAGGWGLVASAAIWSVIWLGVLGGVPVAQRLLRMASRDHKDVVAERSDDERSQGDPGAQVALQESQ